MLPLDHDFKTCTEYCARHRIMNLSTFVFDCGVIVLIPLAIAHAIYGLRPRWYDLSSKAVKQLDSNLPPPSDRKTSDDIDINQPNGNSLKASETRRLTGTNINVPVTNNIKPTKVGILSQNVWCVFVVGGAKRRKRLKILIENIAASIDDIDIICLQEMCLLGLGLFMACGDFQFVRKHLIKLGFIYHSDPKQGAPYFGSSNGTVIFSKYPMYNIYESCFDSKYRRFGRWKGYVSCLIKLGTNNSIMDDISIGIDQNGVGSISNPNSRSSNVITVVNTHLEPFNTNYKRLQIAELCNHVTNCIQDSKDSVIVRNSNINVENNGVNDGFKAVCMGDFNICSNFSWDSHVPMHQRLYFQLENTMKQIGMNFDLFKGYSNTYRDMSEYKSKKCKIRKSKSKRKKKGSETIDHMFVSDEMKKNVILQETVDYKNNNGCIMSDHLGLYVSFRV